jgi:hypothetical protein
MNLPSVDTCNGSGVSDGNCLKWRPLAVTAWFAEESAWARTTSPDLSDQIATYPSVRGRCAPESSSAANNDATLGECRNAISFARKAASEGSQIVTIAVTLDVATHSLTRYVKVSEPLELGQGVSENDPSEKGTRLPFVGPVIRWNVSVSRSTS